MSSETFVNYWIGEEPNPPSPTLDQMPAYVDIAPLAFVGIDPDTWELTFGFLTQHFPAEQIQGWIQQVRANGTKVLLSINDQNLARVPNIVNFAGRTAQTAAEWGVDGLDLDFEPPFESETLVRLTADLRPALQVELGRDPIITAPIYGNWLGLPDAFLKSFAAELDLVTTMDYTPWPGVEGTKENFAQYAEIIGSTEKIAIGMSCMQQPSNFTPRQDLEALTAWEPEGGRKGGAMLYTFSYDIEGRTGSPDGTWTETIHRLLP